MSHPSPIGEVARELYDVLMIRVYRAVGDAPTFALTLDDAGWLWVEDPDRARSDFLLGVFGAGPELKAHVRDEIKSEAIRRGFRRQPSPSVLRPGSMRGVSRRSAKNRSDRPRIE